MSSSVLEIVELANGDVVLRRADSDNEPLINIRFSDISKAYINDSCIDVAKIMIQAGIQAAAHINGAEMMEEGVHMEDLENEIITDPVIH